MSTNIKPDKQHPHHAHHPAKHVRETDLPPDPEEPLKDPKERDYIPDEDPFENPPPEDIPPAGERP